MKNPPKVKNRIIPDANNNEKEQHYYLKKSSRNSKSVKKMKKMVSEGKILPNVISNEDFQIKINQHTARKLKILKGELARGFHKGRSFDKKKNYTFSQIPTKNAMKKFKNPLNSSTKNIHSNMILNYGKKQKEKFKNIVSSKSNYKRNLNYQTPKIEKGGDSINEKLRKLRSKI